MPAPGKYGRRPPKRAAALKLADYLTGVVPVVPASEDYLTALNGGWQMLGNDQAGDCVAVTWANVRRLVTTTLGTASYPSIDEVWKVYQTQNPGFNPDGGGSTGPGSPEDQGMDIQTLLEYLVSTGGPDGVKALGFAQVNAKNPAEVKAAIALFGYVWTGINVLAVNQQEFSDGRPWDYARDSPVDGGHSVVTGGYAPQGVAYQPAQLDGDERFITWAEETSFTDAFWAHEVEEAWIVIWPEHLASKEFLTGIDLTALAADYQEITGKPFPATVTPPKPVPPAPAPAPVVVPPNLIEKIIKKAEALAEESVGDFVNWLKSLA